MELQNATTPPYPCVVCGTSVGPRQGAVECDSCGQWQHLKCETGITWKQYRAAIKNNEDIPFTCQQCGQEQTQGGRSSNGPQEEGRKKNKVAAEMADMDDEAQMVKTFMESLLSEESNIEVRDKYWDLMTVVQQHNEQDTNMDTHNIQMLLLKANEVFEHVKRPREAAIDAQLLKACGNLAKMSIESSHSSLPVFRPREFSEKLIAFLMDEEDEEAEPEENPNLLIRLGRRTQHLTRAVMGVEPFFSAMEWERPAPQARMKKKKEANQVAEQRKVEVSTGDKENETEAVAWKLKILKQCYAVNERKPICFYSFITDPKSFSRTIENLFHLSLLIRELYVEVLEDEDGLPVLQPTQSTANQGMGDHDKQCILSMDMEEWQEIIKTFHITSAMIPPMTKVSRKRK